MTGDVFRYVNGELSAGGIALSEVARAVPTPFYVYHPEAALERLRDLERAFERVPHLHCVALKANSQPALLRPLFAEGAGAEVVSGAELALARALGVPGSRIVFSGVGKTDRELASGLEADVRSFLVESRTELEVLNELARSAGRRARVALRVNPDIDARTHPHISTGLKRNKFGVPLGEAAGLYRELARRPGLEFVGLHAHIGSQIRSLDPLRHAAGALAQLARELRGSGIPLEHLDVGGGLGVAYDGAEEPDVAAYGAAMVEATRDAGLTLILEPGRWLMAPAGALIASVVDVKPAPGDRRFVVLDAGMTELIRPALYDAFHRIVMVAPRVGAPEVTCDVVGPVCESSDTFGRDRRLEDPQVGDLVAVLDAGAYGSVMASNYNRRPQPAEVLVDHGAWRLVRRRQTIEEQMTCEA